MGGWKDDWKNAGESGIITLNHRALSQWMEDAQWIQQRFDAVFPPEAPLDRNAFPGVAKVPPIFAWTGFSGGGMLLEFPMVGWNSALYSTYIYMYIYIL